MNLPLSTHQEAHCCAPLPHVGRGLGCGFPIIYSSERISGCTHGGTVSASRSGCGTHSPCPDPFLARVGPPPRVSECVQTSCQNMTPLFLSRPLTRVPVQSFERGVGGRALGGSRNFEILPGQEYCPHFLLKCFKPVCSPYRLGSYIRA